MRDEELGEVDGGGSWEGVDLEGVLRWETILSVLFGATGSFVFEGRVRGLRESKERDRLTSCRTISTKQ